MAELIPPPGGGSVLAEEEPPNRRKDPPPSGPSRLPAAVFSLVAVAVAAAPLIHPKGPGNSAPVDVLMALSVLALLGWALTRHGVVRLPYAVPVTGLVLVGIASAMVNDNPAGGGQAVLQEVFLLLWCAAVVSVCRTSRAVRLLLRVWAMSAVAWAVVLVVAVLADLTAINGATGERGTRARLFFDHPNMAGNFFVIAVFVLVASGFPRRLPLRIGACLLLVAAMFLTGSNAALLSLVAGALVTVFLHLRSRSGLVPATAVLALLLAVSGTAFVYVVPVAVSAAAESDNPLIKYSIGRGARSAEARTELFTNQVALYESGSLLGLGPAGTKAALEEVSAARVKEAHNDYLATLVERGPLGLLALAGLIGVVVARLARITGAPLRGELARAVPVPAALAGACVVFALTALTHEILHYRWLWTLLGVVAAVHLLATRADDGRPLGAGVLPHGAARERPADEP